MIGISKNEYDEMTPSELNIHIEDYHKKEQLRVNEGIALAHLNAYLQRVKKMPQLSELLEKEKKQQKATMTDEEMFERIKALNASLGGVEIT